MHWFLDPIVKQYADFNGRTTRKEYWMFILVSLLIGVGIGIIMAIAGAISSSLSSIMGLILIILILGIIIPSIAIQIRRLHDIGRSGWWWLLSFIPYIGGLILLVMYCLPSQKGSNKYGINKHEGSNASVAQPAFETQAQVPGEPIAQ